MSCVPFTNTWIEPNRILIGSIPQTADAYRALRGSNIQAILSCTRRDPQTYPGMSVWSEVRWHHAPIPDGGLADDDTMFKAVAFVDQAYRDGLPLYVHCRGGIGRSGAILIAYYVLYRDMTVTQARDTVRIRRNYEGNACAADQGSPQREWLDALGNRVTL